MTVTRDYHADARTAVTVLFDLLDDLTINQYQQLITWLWVRNIPVTRANIKSWRIQEGLPCQS